MQVHTNILKLNTSWTKYDAVKVIEIIANNNLQDYLPKAEGIEGSILRSVLGINNLNDPYPRYWDSIQEYPKQLRLFTLIATLFTHHNNIKNFAEKFSQKGRMGGTFEVKPNDKVSTNIRSALVISGASLENYRREIKVPYNFSALFENGEIGLLMKGLLKDRLNRIGYKKDEIESTSHFVDVCYNNNFIQALGLTKKQFQRWIQGEHLDPTEEIFQFEQLKIYKEIPMMRVHQWMNDWDDIDFKSDLRRKPDPYFFIFSIDARLLKKISDVHRRNPDKERRKDIAVQRNLKDQRVQEIRNYIEGGFPWSTISKQDQKLSENEDLKMPGLLPTAIIANILAPDEERNGKRLIIRDHITVLDKDNKGNKFPIPKLVIPDHIFDDQDWDPELKPFEIIDGQHRLWAFDEDQTLSGNYELPVIAFNNLDRAWQAYLFYTINIKPVKINTSLGFDLYPLLRTQKWLENSKDGLLAYRETRAQEIVEALWIYEESPWYQRINMLGDAGGPTMSQAAFIRALVNSFFKNKGGMYSDKLNETYKIITWNRSQQAAFIILLWQKIADAVESCKEEWAQKLRTEEKQSSIFEINKEEKLDKAFTSKNSFLSRDQGVRGILSFANDLFYIAANYNDIDFNEFVWLDDLDEISASTESQKYSIGEAIRIFQGNGEFIKLIENFAEASCLVDWRTSSANFEKDSDKERQMKYRGSGGYSEFWKELSSKYAQVDFPLIKKYANQLVNK